MVNLKRRLESILNSKNYKFIIYLLMGLILVFLICGNYNLVEAFTLNQYRDHVLNNIGNKFKNANDKQENIKIYYSDDEKRRNNTLKRNFGGMAKSKNMVKRMDKDDCLTNFSNIGLHPGNPANKMVNTQCNSLKLLKNKNKFLLN